MAPSAAITVKTEPPNAGADPQSYVLAVLMLAVFALLAWRRRRYSPAQRPQGRWSRAAISSLFFAGSVSILTVSENLGDPIGSLLGITVIGFILFAAAAFLMIAVIEFAIWRARASRTKRWLFGAPLLFSVACAILLVATSLGLGMEFSEAIGWDLVQFFAIAVGVSFIWWSYLPTRPTEVSRLFE